jgi:uncharacterized protein (DUF983 family)
MHLQIMNKYNKVVDWKAVQEEEEAHQAVDHLHTVVGVVITAVIIVLGFTVMVVLISWLEWVGIITIITMLITVIMHAKIAGLLMQNVLPMRNKDKLILIYLLDVFWEGSFC